MFRLGHLLKIRNNLVSPKELLVRLQAGHMPNISHMRIYLLRHFSYELSKDKISEATVHTMAYSQCLHLLKQYIHQHCFKVPIHIFSLNILINEGVENRISIISNLELSIYHTSSNSVQSFKLPIIQNQNLNKENNNQSETDVNVFERKTNFIDISLDKQNEILKFIFNTVNESNVTDPYFLFLYHNTSDDRMQYQLLGIKIIEQILDQNIFNRKNNQNKYTQSNHIQIPLDYSNKFNNCNNLQFLKNNSNINQDFSDHSHIVFSNVMNIIKETHRKRPVTNDKRPPVWAIKDLAIWLELDKKSKTINDFINTGSSTKNEDTNISILVWKVLYSTLYKYGDDSLDPVQQLISRCFTNVVTKGLMLSNKIDLNNNTISEFDNH